jgi:hypothetical protein
MVLALLLASQAQALPRGFSGLHATPYVNMSWFLVAFELGPWDEYLLNELTPDLERLTYKDMPRVSWLQVDDQLIIPDFAVSLLSGDARSALVFSLFQRHSALGYQDHANGSFSNSMGFEQSLVMPGITHRVTDRSALTVSAVLASQRYGASGMNLRETDSLVEADRGTRFHPYGQSELAQGAGVRLALSSDLLSNLTLEAAFQSRIEMAEFASLRGVHGSRAELDIPSRIQLGLQLHATQRSSISIGVAQIFYSEVGAFPSRSLPARFTALLGDSTSPQFDWDDLLVYNIGWQWQQGDDLAFFLDYRTRSQPKPTAPALASALGPELAQNAFMAGVSKGLGDRTSFRLNAAYAPPEFAFGGNVLGIVTDKLDQSVEVQATLSFSF